MTSKDEELFVSRVRDALDNEMLDEDISERLATARRNALNELDTAKKTSQGNWYWIIWAPASAMAVALFAMAVFLSSPKIPEFPYYESELQAATAGELELMQELEFVAWMLSEEPNAG